MKTPVRKSTVADVPRLYEVWHSAVEGSHDFVAIADRARIADIVRERYLPAADLDVVVDDNDVPLAFMGMTGNEIHSLFVHQDAWGMGLGRSLVELAISREPVLRTEVNEQNHGAVAFWKRMGFRQIDRTEIDAQGRPYPLLRMEWTG